MAKLTKGMFGSEFNHEGMPDAAKAFGIRTGQMRIADTGHNVGWYNQAGEKLGWGDLDPEDFARIQKNLDEGETFVILGESDSFWHFVRKGKPLKALGWMQETEPTMEAPGRAYVAAQARYFITAQGLFYVVDHFDHHEDGAPVTLRHGAVATAAGRDAVELRLGVKKAP